MQSDAEPLKCTERLDILLLTSCITLLVRNIFGAVCWCSHWGCLFLIYSFLATDSNLQICQHKVQTCCTRKMEESYQAAVRRERMENIQTLNFELKYMIVGHITAFQGRNIKKTVKQLLPCANKCIRTCLLARPMDHLVRQPRSSHSQPHASRKLTISVWKQHCDAVYM